MYSSEFNTMLTMYLFVTIPNKEVNDVQIFALGMKLYVKFS